MRTFVNSSLTLPPTLMRSSRRVSSCIRRAPLATGSENDLRDVAAPDEPVEGGEREPEPRGGLLRR